MKRRSFLGLVAAIGYAPAGVVPMPVRMDVEQRVDDIVGELEEIKPGWRRLSSGLIVQWGIADKGGYSELPVALGSVMLAHATLSADDSVEPLRMVEIHRLSRTGITVSVEGANWMVIGC